MIWFFAEAVEILLTILLAAPRELHLAETIFFGLLAVSVCRNCELGIGFDNSVKPDWHTDLRKRCLTDWVR